MMKPQYLVDDEGKKVGVLISIMDYESLLDKVDDAYCDELFDKACEVNEPGIALEEYLKNRSKAATDGLTVEDLSKAEALYEPNSKLPSNIQSQFYKTISLEFSDKHGKNLAVLSNDSFAEIWNAAENDQWDQFLKDKLDV